MSEIGSNAGGDVGNHDDFQNLQDENSDFEEEEEEVRVLEEPEVANDEIPVGDVTPANKGILMFYYI